MFARSSTLVTSNAAGLNVPQPQRNLFMNTVRKWLLLTVVGALCFSPAAAVAHESPEHVVEELTLLMERRGVSAELLYRRACEYRVLGKLNRAVDDLMAAVSLNPGYLPAQLELSRVQLALGRVDDARSTIETASRLASAAAQQAAVHMIRCDIASATGQHKEALEECEHACRLVPSQVEWLLRRSRIQAELGEHKSRIAALEAARAQNASAVLGIELVEAKLDAGQADQVLAEIEAELADSRWQSSWLIRRARAWLLLDEKAKADADLDAAIAEINLRLNPRRPDVSLLADRGLAYALLGQMKEATADLEAAQQRTVDAESLNRLKKLVETRPVQILFSGE